MRQGKVNSILIHDEKEELMGIFTSSDVIDILLAFYKWLFLYTLKGFLLSHAILLGIIS